MTKAHALAHSLLGKWRIPASEVEGKVNNTHLVDEILRKHGYRKVFDRTSTSHKGWAISERFTKHNEYLA
ncbi:hypothetical protein [uncultured Moraxella sp.]|uniref:hypothetical protein n=1 Tax=uncultured Moraxella sp. TaxID=263769 RepID=UPI0025EB1824|nr:hypothetical protein [uncultured Moraxella sp.]